MSIKDIFQSGKDVVCKKEVMSLLWRQLGALRVREGAGFMYQNSSASSTRTC